MALKTRYTNVGGQVAAVKTGGQRYFVEPDALGNVRGLVNQSGVRSQTYTYWPYGEVRTSTGSVSQPLQFCGTWGYYTESSTKQYVRARYYMQSIGRWQTVDPLWPREMAYGYAFQNPLFWLDPTGRACWMECKIIGPIYAHAFLTFKGVCSGNHSAGFWPGGSPGGGESSQRVPGLGTSVGGVGSTSGSSSSSSASSAAGSSLANVPGLLLCSGGVTLGIGSSASSSGGAYGGHVKIPDDREGDDACQSKVCKHSPAFEKALCECVKASYKNPKSYVFPMYTCGSWAADMWSCAMNKVSPPPKFVEPPCRPYRRPDPWSRTKHQE